MHLGKVYIKKTTLIFNIYTIYHILHHQSKEYGQSMNCLTKFQGSNISLKEPLNFYQYTGSTKTQKLHCIRMPTIFVNSSKKRFPSM